MNTTKKVAFLTLGCKTNQYETNGMMQKFIEAGYKICNLEENPDIYVVNTCTVTNIADRKSRQSLRRIKEKKGLYYNVLPICLLPLLNITLCYILSQVYK